MKQSDLKQFIDALRPILVTKDDIKGLATKIDISKLDSKVEKMDEKVTKLDSKVEYVDIKMDAFLGEILDSRETQELQSKTLTDHSDQLEKHHQRIHMVEHRLQSTPTPIISSI